MNPPALKYFFFFNPTLSKKEGTEHEKILFFHPPSVNIDEQTRNVGLSEALTQFTNTFSDRKCESVRREKHTCAFFNPEQDTWVAMMVRNPYISRTGKDGKATQQFFEDEVDDAVLQTIVRQAYKSFRLFNGPINPMLESQGPDAVRAKLQAFIPSFISSLNFEQLDIFVTLEGIQFLPVDKNVYLRIQSYINLTEDHFPKVQYAAFLYRDHLVWSGLEQDDMRIVYSYLTSSMASADIHPSRIESATPPKIRGRAGFVTGPDDLNSTTPITAPRVFVGNNQQYYLIVYEHHDISSLFLVEQSSLQDRSLYQQLDQYILPHLNFLSPVLADLYSRKHGNEDQYRYVYFNHMNLAMKTSLKQKGSDLPRETMKMLNEIHTDFERQPSVPSEVLIRTTSDRWLVGRKSDQREFYVFFDSKNANLLEINEEVRKLSGTYFNNIFID